MSAFFLLITTVRSRAVSIIISAGFVFPSRMSAAISPEVLHEQLQGPLQQVVACAQDCLRLAGVAPQALDAIYLTGGSSALRTLRDALREAFPGVPQVEGDLFGGVATGLAYA